jgi:hypothetical protein
MTSEPRPVSGSYTYDDIDLSVFHGISWMGHARGRFSGPLGCIWTNGNPDVGIEGSRLTDPNSKPALTASARADKANLRSTLMRIHGPCALGNGIASTTDVRFTAPGSDA